MNGAANGPRTDEGRLLEAMEDELRLLGALRSMLGRMDEAVERDDAEGVDEAVYAAHRVMQTLAQAQLRRAALAEIGELRGMGVSARAPLVQAAVARLMECGVTLEAEIRGRCSALERTLKARGYEWPGLLREASASRE